MEKAIWLIRFADGRIRSHWGTREEAETIAESLKAERGDYIII